MVYTKIFLKCMITIAVTFGAVSRGQEVIDLERGGVVSSSKLCVDVEDTVRCVTLLKGQQCSKGYTGTPPYCTDINECDTNNGGCEWYCINEIGSHRCTFCMEGYSKDGQYCQDINECKTDNGGCGHYCTNTNGSYECSCKEGLILAEDSHSCVEVPRPIHETQIDVPGNKHVVNFDIDECAVSNGGCDHTCHNTNGSFYCTCNSGYILLEDDRGCTDIDECSVNNGDCEQGCNNSIGDYNCYCFDGYSLENDTFCEDIDECLTDNGGCGHNCSNTNGSYVCSCADGFTLNNDNTTCEETYDDSMTSTIWLTQVLPLILGVCLLVFFVFCAFMAVYFISLFVAKGGNKYAPVKRGDEMQNDQTNDDTTTDLDEP